VINPEELAICRKRGHQMRGLVPDHGWVQCDECGMWVRIVRVTEEREDEPPEEEIDLSVTSARRLDALKKKMDKRDAERRAER
jgi:hypothetical protein